jgi:hypothetical protein
MRVAIRLERSGCEREAISLYSFEVFTTTARFPTLEVGPATSSRRFRLGIRDTGKLRACI